MLSPAVKKIYYKPPEESRTFMADIIRASSLISQSLVCLFHGHLS